MLNKEYIVFAAFLLVNVLLALNCITLAVKEAIYKNENDLSLSEALQADLKTSNPDEQSDKSHPLIISDLYMTIVTKNQLQLDYSWYNFKHILCIEIQDTQNLYTNQNITTCEKKPVKDFNSFYRIPIAHAKTIIEPNLDKIEEVITNSNFADNLIFLLNDKSYLVVNINKTDIDSKVPKILTSANSMIRKFLVNKNGNIFRKKVNAMLRLNLEIDSNSCISFFFFENLKGRAIIIDLQNPNPTFRNLKHIMLSIFHPIATVLDIVLLPVELAYIYLELKLNQTYDQ